MDQEFEGFIDFSIAEADLPKFIYLLKEGIWYAEHLRVPVMKRPHLSGATFCRHSNRFGWK